MADVVKRALDVRVEDPGPLRPGRGQLKDPLKRIGAATLDAEPVGAILEPGLPERLKRVLDGRLEGAVHDSRDAERALPAVSLGDIDPSCRARLPGLERTEPVHQPPSGLRGLEDDLVPPGGVLPSVGLCHPTHREDPVLVGAKHDPLEGANLLEVAFSCSSEEVLTELANRPDRLVPVNAVPVASGLRRAYGYLFARLVHRRAPQESSVNHQSEVSTLAGRATRPYPAGYGFPSPLGRRRWLALTTLTRWGIGPPLRSAYRESHGRQRAYPVAQDGDTAGLGALFAARAEGVSAADLKHESVSRGGSNTPASSPMPGLPVTQLQPRVPSRSPYQPFPSPGAAVWIGRSLGVGPSFGPTHRWERPWGWERTGHWSVVSVLTSFLDALHLCTIVSHDSLGGRPSYHPS